MSSGGPRLGHVEPRERAGAQTGRKYEYQYERTARAVLDLLSDDGKHVCVYCDWHDDFVVEIGQPSTRYVFHQVKGRITSMLARNVVELNPGALHETIANEPLVNWKSFHATEAIQALVESGGWACESTDEPE